MNWRKILAGSNAGFWLFISLVFFGSMIWAKSRDPFERIWFTLKTPHYGKIKGVAVLPVRVGTRSAVTDRALKLPVVYYTYGSGGSLINCGNELRQLAELGMAAVVIGYNQTNELAFEEEFIALREYVAKQKWAAANAEPGTRSEECWLGFSLGAQRTLSFLLNHPELQPQLYVRLAGGAVSEEFKVQSSKFKVAELSTLATRHPPQVLLVHGQNDEIFPVAEAKRVAEFFQTNGVATELKILSGKGHAFDVDRAVVIRNVGEYIKAQLTPNHPQPEFPATKNYPFVCCIAPTFLWVGFWIYLRTKGSTGDSPVLAGDPPASSQKLKHWEIGLRVTASILVTLALVQTGIHLITPRLSVSDSTLRIARKWLLAPKWKEDFETLATKPFWHEQRLKTLLTHVELANYCVYELINWKVDREIYNNYVLSPIIDSESDFELNWRRPLWEFFYPRIRKEDSPEAAAGIVVRNLRERVTISAVPFSSVNRMPTAHWPTGIETIWRDQITDEKGFERIYVATLRSVGVGARLNGEGMAEFWTGSEWKGAPRPIIQYF